MFKVLRNKGDWFRKVKRYSIFGMTSFTTEDNKRATDFVNLHRFTTRSAFGIREREVFAFVRMGKFEGTMAKFAKELLVTVFVMTVLYKLVEPHLGQESVELFISGNLLCKSWFGGCPLFKG